MSKDNLKQNLSKFKRKHHLNQLIKGSLISVICIISIVLIISTLESIFWTNQAVRLTFLIVLLGVFATSLILGVIYPALALFKLRKGVTDEQAATIIGKHFPEVQDKLLNYLQLEKLNKSQESLIAAAIKQKTNDLKLVPFTNAINFKPNLKFAYIFLGLIVFCLLVSFMSPGFFKESSSRIIQFDKEFIKPAPFQFHVDKDMHAYKNEPFEFTVDITGEYIPNEVFIVESGRKIRLNKTDDNSFKFNYPALSNDKSFILTASGYSSDKYRINVYERPEIRDFSIHIDYPSYTGMEDKTLNNTGSVIVPEGSKLKWELNTSMAEDVSMVTDTITEPFSLSEEQKFTFDKTIRNSYNYEIKLENSHASNKSRIVYEISVIKDERPEISVKYLADTLTFNSIILSGAISDDYGFYSLDLIYKKGEKDKYHKVSLPFIKDQSNQSFFYEWNLDTLQLSDSDFIELFVSVRDNDGYNGYKQSISEKFYLTIPNEKEMEKLIDKTSNAAEDQLNKTELKAEAIKEKLAKLEERLKNKSKLDWQGEKLAEDIIKEKKELEKSIEKLKEQHEDLINSQKEFNKQSKKLQEKAKKLQELINEIMDEETKKMYEELQKMLKEKSSSDEMLNKVSQLKSKEKNLEKELERALELFKRLKFETKLEQTAEKLEKLGEEQQKLGEESEEINKKDKSEANEQKEQQLKEKQEEIKKEFEEIKKEFDKAEELNQDLKNPEPLEDFNKEEQDIQEKLDEIPQDMQKQDFNKAGQKQKNAGQKMKKMSDGMKKMQMSMEMNMMQENLDHLRDILDNLIKLSFEEERILNEFKNVQQIDPRFIELSQEQLKLMENAKVIEDSLLSLANRVVQISNFVTREIGEINSNLDNAMGELRERNKGKATSHQQFAMTSMNNLALLLDDVLSQMQMAMAEAMGQPQKGQQSQQSLPSMGDLQKELSEQIQQLKKSGKSGRELSEELAKLASEQAELRRQLQEMQEKLGGQPNPDGEGDGGKDAGTKLKEAIEKMEENETDLVNKRLTNELIERQQDILTRMLEAEESLREQKQSPEREGETAKDKIRKVPPAFEEYFKAKQSEIELLKTIPLDLNPFYKKEVNDYFRRLSGQNK